MLARAKPHMASLTKVSLIVSQARLERVRTRRGANMPAQPPDREHHLGVTPAAFSSFAQFPVFSPVDSPFCGQAECNPIRFWPGRGLPSRGPMPGGQSGVSLTAIVAFAKTRP